MTIDQVMHIVQASFPQIYLACHTRHHRKRSTDHRLSSRDASILAHLDVERPISPSSLARHLGVSRSTVSEALKRLTTLGFVMRPTGTPTRQRDALLTAKGAQAIRDISVLEAGLLRAALEAAAPADLPTIARGMTRLAEACRNSAGELKTR
jgi:DNA-binding MarR family transcriptional regulator